MDPDRGGDVWGDRTRRLRYVFFVGHLPLDNRSHEPSDNSGPRRRLERSVRTGSGGSVGHGRECVHFELHADDRRGSEGDRQRDVVDDIPEGHELGLGACHNNR
jgi:hypothetical protein